MVYFSSSLVSLFILSLITNKDNVSSFTTNIKRSSSFTTTTTSSLHMSFGLGPGSTEEVDATSVKEEKIEGIDYVVPNHELFRKTRLTKIDEQADDWISTLLGSIDDNDNDDSGRYPLGDVSKNIMKRILTPVTLQEDVSLYVYLVISFFYTLSCIYIEHN